MRYLRRMNSPIARLVRLLFSAALMAGALNSRLAARPSLSAWLHKGAGAILMLLGLRLIWADR